MPRPLFYLYLNEDFGIKTQAWVDLDPKDLRRMLISFIGRRFGERPEEGLDEIRAECRRYAASFLRMAAVRKTDLVLDLGSGCGFGTAALAQPAGSPNSARTGINRDTAATCGL